MRRVTPGLMGLSLCLASSLAWSQTTVPFNQNTDMQTFRPAPGANNFLTVAGSRVLGRTAPVFGLWGNYANRPLTIFNASCPNSFNDDGCTVGDVRSRPIEHLATFNFQFSLVIAQRVQLSLDLPLTLEQGQAVDPRLASPIVSPSGATQSQSAFALGDPRIEAKVRIVGDGLQGAGFAIRAYGTVPTGHLTGGDGHFIADDTLTLGGQAIGDFRYGRFFSAVNLGATWRPDTLTVLSTTVGTRLVWGAAAGVSLTPRLAVLAEGYGSSDLTSRAQNNAVEVDLAARYMVGDFTFTLGGGTGVIRGAGAPVARGFLGLVWAPVRVDSDDDGVADAIDRCPNEAEDRDGYEDDDGCPEPDNDGDDIPDATDRCPDQPEDRDNFQDADGCPDLDNDNDGVPDGYDTCPREPEDRDGDHDEDGCPDNDRDRDGIQDDRDRCPGQPEDTDGFQDEDGCPDPDNDGDGIPDTEDQCSEQPETRNGVDDTDGCPDGAGDRDNDGIPDARDRCPDQPETRNGVQDDDGCPEANAAPLAQVVGETIQFSGSVNFDTGSDRIVGAQSFAILDNVAQVLRSHPELGHVEVQGHTDNAGNADANRSLSQRRADAVKVYLVAHGVDASRLTTRGFGPDQPIESNATHEGRSHNRRVEFHIQH